MLLTLVYNKTNQTHDIVPIVYLFKVLFLDIYPISPMLQGIYIDNINSEDCNCFDEF